MASLLWAPLNLGDFTSPVEQQAFVSLRKWLGPQCSNLLARASPQIEATLQSCSSHGCTMTSCPLHTGCILFTAQTLMPGSADDVTVEWRSLLSLTAFHRHKLLQAALKYDRSREVLILMLIPADILAPLMRPEVVADLGGVGVFGVGTVPLGDLSKALVHVCFQEALEQLPPGVVKIEPHMLHVDPTNPEKLPPINITGMDENLHGALPLMPWGSQTAYAWPAPASAEPAAAQPAGPAAAQPEQPAQPDQLGDADAAQPGKESSSGQQPQQEVDQERTASDLSALQLSPAIPLTPAQQRIYLQSTINKFWMTVGDMAQRLTNRVRKIRCRERVTCDGVSCTWCRGAMVFSVAALEGPSGQAWRYSYQGAELMSNTPKQYIRGEWRTVYELVQRLGTLDVELVRTVTTHDRKKGYVQALHIPRHLVADCLPHAPPAGLLFWRLIDHPELQAPSPLPGQLPNFGSLPPYTRPGSTIGIPTSFSPQPPERNLPPIKSEYTYSSADEEPTSHDVGMISEQPPPQQPATPALPAGPRQCCAPGCSVLEARYTGVALLICSGCKGVAYCTPEHQRQHWRVHRKVCVDSAVNAELSGPRAGQADM